MFDKEMVTNPTLSKTLNNFLPKPSVKNWLIDISLSFYAKNFYENGFDNMDSVCLLDDKTLKVIGIDKIGHRMKILNDIKLYVQKLKKDEMVSVN